MWKLILAEFEYYKIYLQSIFIITFILFSFILIFAWDSAELEIPGISSLMVGIAILIIAIRSIKSAREKRERVIAILPIQRWKIGLARLLFLDLFWILILFSFIIILVMSHWDNLFLGLIWYFLSLSSVIFIFNAAPIIQQDLAAIFINKIMRDLLTIIYLLVFFSFYFIFLGARAFSKYFSFPQYEFLSGEIHKLSPTIEGTVIFACVAILLSLFSLFLYHKRQLYFQ